MNLEKNFRFRLNEFKNQFEKRFLEKIGDRKIIAYGATGRWWEINSVIYIHDLVEFFVDGNPDRWGEQYCGKEIKSIAKLKNLDTKKYAVVVSTAYFEDVKKVLDRYKLKQDVDYFNFFQYVHLLYWCPIGSLNTFMRFLNTVPSKIADITPEKKEQRIGIVVNMETLNSGVTDLPASIAMFLMLKWKGYNAKLIVDRLHWGGDILLYEGHCDLCDQITSIILERLKTIVPQEDIMYLEPVSSSALPLSEKDKEECKTVARCATNWDKWINHFYARFLRWDSLYHTYAGIYEKNFSFIDTFFNENHFDVINVPTALHKRGGIYQYICRKRQIRITSEDGLAEGTVTISANGAAGCNMDTPRLIEEWLDPQKEPADLLERAVSMWNKRKELTATVSAEADTAEYRKVMEKNGYAYTSFQPSRKETDRSYDVVIPLNCKCDGGALVADSLFGSLEEWIEEVLDFIINKLGKSVLVREHPSGRVESPVHSCTELYATNPEILERYKDNNLFHYVRSYEEINLYQYMETCKVVLPWTSTVGLEAALMRKNVLVHTNVYYQNSDFVLSPQNGNEYFEMLESCLASDNWLVPDQELAYTKALKYFYYTMHRLLVTRFNIFNTDQYPWKFENFEDLLEEQGVEEILRIVAEDIPSVYLIEQQHRKIYDV